MNQIWTNPSLQKSAVIRSGVTTNLLYCLKLTVTDADSGATKNTIVFPNMEYDFKFYDPTYSKLYSIVGLVEDVYEDQIKIKYIQNNTKSSSSSSITTVEGMPNCNCILSTPDISKYEGPAIIFVPIANIVNITYKWAKNNTDIQDTTEVRVMLLGVSATAIKAIIIRMAFFEDSVEEAVKLVDLKAGNIYDLTYESRNGAIYESRVKVMSVEDAANTDECKPGKGYVREHVGCGNSVYTDCSCSKDEFMTSPPAKKYKIVVDTSESFVGRYETIMLDAIRDCTLVYDAYSDPSSDINDNRDYCKHCAHKTRNCNPRHCGHYLPPVKPGCECEPAMPKTYVYTYKNMCKAVVSGEKVCITAEGRTTEVDLESLVKYYLGVE